MSTTSYSHPTRHSSRSRRRAFTGRNRLDRYLTALAELPPPGSGQYHTRMMRVAILGFRAGLGRQRIHSDLRRRAVEGTRHVPEREIVDTLDNATAEVASSRLSRTDDFVTGRITREGIMACEAVVDAGRGLDERYIMDASPIDVTGLATWDFLRHLYKEDDVIFLGERHEAAWQNITTAKAWYNGLRYGNWPVPPHIIPNPLTGRHGQRRNSAGMTLRGDSCVSCLRFCVVEFDSLPLDAQIAFWAAARLPVAALIDSGGKSIHAWLRVNCGSAEEWQERIVRRLYGGTLIPMGVDSSCRNPSRLSRMPGHTRIRDDGTAGLQRCIYLAPRGRPVMAANGTDNDDDNTDGKETQK